MEEMMKMMKLKQQGFYCSQILLLMALQEQGRENPDLIRAAGALAGGLGFSGEVCGSLTGGACLLGLYAGKGTPQEREDSHLFPMVDELVTWFKETYNEAYGGIRCDEILSDNPKNQANRCPGIVLETYHKVKELLLENEYELSGERDDE